MAGPTVEQRFQDFVRHGDTEALAEVFDRTAAKVFGVARHLATDATAAEDLLQATFLTAIEKRHAFDGSRPLVPWLLGILRFHASRLRALSRRAPDPERLRHPVVPDPAVTAATGELEGSVLRAADQLAPAYRAVLVLKLLHGLTPAEIAVALGESPGAVRTRLHRALQLLREALPAGVGIPALIVLPVECGPASVRAELVSHLTAHPILPSGTVPWLATGVLAVKKKLAVLFAVIVVGASLATWCALDAGASVPALDLSEPHATPAARSAEALPAPVASDQSSARRTAEVQATPTRFSPPAAPGLRTGSLTVALRTVSGKVPVPNARVTLRSIASAHVVQSPLVQRTDDTGAVRFDALTAGPCRVVLDRRGPDPAARVRGTADDTSYVQADATIQPGEASRIELEVEDGLLVDGIVVDAAGVPVPGATVWCATFSAPPHAGEPVARTDAAGRFTLCSMAGYHWLSASAPGHGPSRAFSPWRASDPDARRVELRLELGGAGGSLTGQVVDRDGHPVAGAELVVGRSLFETGHTNGDRGLWSGQPVPALLRADAGGRFTVQGLDTGVIPVRASARGFVKNEVRATVTAGKTASIVVVLERACLVRGMVADQEHRPVEGAWVTARRDDRVLASARSDRRGEFLLQGLGAGAVSCRAEAAHHRPAHADLACGAGAELTLELVLEPAGRITGWAGTHDGLPLRGWLVEARATSGSSDELPVAPIRDDGSFTLETDARRGYRLALIDRAHTHVDLGPRGAPPRTIRCDWLGEVAGGSTGVRIAVAEDVQGFAALSGRALDATGAVPAAALVVSRGDGEIVTWVGLGTDGRFRSGPLLPGAYDVRVQPKDRDQHAPLLLARQQLVAGARVDLGELRLPPSGLLVLDVSIESGQGIHAYVLDADQRQVTQLVVEPHARARQALPAGSYLLRGFVIGTFGHGTGQFEQPFRIDAGAECIVPIHRSDPNRGKEERPPAR